MTSPLSPGLLSLRDAYDSRLRDQSEMAFAASVDRDGPLWRGKFGGGRGFVSYRSLDGLAGAALDDLIARTVAFYAADPDITEFEWKTRGHDAPADLPQRLLAHGFQAEDRETVMVGEAQALAVDVPLPAGVTVRRVNDQADPLPDLQRAARMQAEVFGRDFGWEGLAERLQRSGGLVELWIAEAGGQVVSAGRVDSVAGTEFAGLWGGATLPEWRGQGIYRALTAARARSALARGVRYLHSDSTEFSRPILERSGLHAVTTTTPYIWRR